MAQEQERQRATRRYRPTVIILGTYGLHVIALCLVVWVPAARMVVFWALLANHLILTLAGLWPRSRVLGPNMVRVEDFSPDTVYLTFDDGPDPLVTPRVLDLLDAMNFKATFFVKGEQALRFPDLVREIVLRGHGIANHSHHHAVTFAFQSIGGVAKELKVAQTAIGAACGRTPRYFRAPFGFRSPFLEPALCRMGLDLVSWTRRGFDTRCRDSALILKRLLRGLKAGDILLLHDIPLDEGDPSAEPIVLRVLPILLKELQQASLRSEALPEWESLTIRGDSPHNQIGQTEKKFEE